jgi:hypothetical protein
MTSQKAPEKSGLDEVIDDLLSQLKGYTVEEPEYSEIIDMLEKVYTIKSTAEPQKTQRVSPDVLVTVLGNLAGIVTIIGFERTHVIASKALSFVLKPRA